MNAHASAAWVDALEALVDAWPDTVVVAGPGSTDLAAGCRRAGAPPVAAEGSGLALLAHDDVPWPTVAYGDLPRDWAGLVVLRSAWRHRTEVGPALRAAARVLRPGGRILAGEMDVARLLETSAVRYPSRLLFSARPDLAAEVRATTMGRAMLSAETVRAGFGDVDVVDLEEERGVFPSADAYWEYARGGGWPALEWLSADDAERVIEDAADDLSRIAPLGPVVDRVPFVATTGIRR